MKITYNLSGAARKNLVVAISHELNTPSKYLGAPYFAYQVGDYTIDKFGTVTGRDNWELVADLQGLYSLAAVSAEYDTPSTAEPSEEPDNMTCEDELGVPQRREGPQGENGMSADDIPDEITGPAIEMPLARFCLAEAV